MTRESLVNRGGPGRLSRAKSAPVTLILALALSVSSIVSSKATAEVPDVEISRSALLCFISNYDQYEAIGSTFGRVVVNFDTCPDLPTLADVMDAMNLVQSLGTPKFSDEPQVPLIFSQEEASCLFKNGRKAIIETQAAKYRILDFGCVNE